MYCIVVMHVVREMTAWGRCASSAQMICVVPTFTSQNVIVTVWEAGKGRRWKKITGSGRFQGREKGKLEMCEQAKENMVSYR